MKTAAVIVATWVIGFVACGAWGYEVAKDHPRIFIHQQDLPELARRCGPGGPFASEYQALKTAVDAVIESREPLNIGEWLPEIPLVYVVEKALGHDAARYSDFVRRQMWGSDGRGAGSSLDYVKRNSFGSMGHSGVWFAWDALVYDWMYDAFTPEERRTYAEVLGPWLRSRGWMRGPAPSAVIQLEQGFDNLWYNQTWAFQENYAFGNYYMRQGVGPKVFAALAIYGEGTRYDEDAKTYLDSFDKEMRSRFLPALDARGGVPTEGPAHGTAMLKSMALALEAYRSATGEDLFKLLGRHGLLAETPLWYAYAQLPHSGQMAPIDDLNPEMSLRPSKADEVIALIARRFGQPVAQYLAMEHFRSMPGTKPGLRTWQGRNGWADILWLDPVAKATAPDQLPTAYHFPGSGHVYMHSKWDDPDATWAYFGAGDRIVNAWGSDDEGSFQIYKGGPLAPLRGRGDAILHNMVMVHDPDEKARGANDGGLRDWYQEEGWGTRPQAAGKIVAFENRPEYTWALADLSRAYDAAKMRSYRRAFLYLRAEPECFVVYDRVEATEADFPKTWQMYAMNEPRVLKGAGLAAKADSPHAGCSVYQPGADSFFVTTYRPDDNLKKRANASFPYKCTGFGTMMVRVLLPEKAVLTVRGGTSYGQWGNPHAPAGRPQADPRILYGRWRVEEEPTEKAGMTEFLNVLIPKLVPEGEAEKGVTGDSLTFATAEVVAQDAQRIRLLITSDRGTWEIELPRQAGQAGSVKRVEAGTGRPPFSSVLSETIQENGEVPGYTWNPTAQPR